MQMKKVTFKDGGYIVIPEDKIKTLPAREVKDIVSTDDATEQDIENYKDNAKFMKMVNDFVAMAENWDADRSSVTSRYRYSVQDIFNLFATLKNKEPIVITDKPLAKQGFKVVR